METKEINFINETVDPTLLIKYLQYNKHMEELMNNTKVTYVAKEVVFVIEDISECEVEYKCNIECTFNNEKVSEYTDSYIEKHAKAAKKSGEVLEKGRKANEQEIEEMIGSSHIARKAIIEYFKITEEKYAAFCLGAEITSKENKMKKIDKEMEEQYKIIEKANKKIKSLQGIKNLLFQEMCELLDEKDKEKIKQIGIKV